MESCSAKSGDQPDRLLIDHALITSDLALPPDIVFTDIIATSPAGYDFEPVAVVGESPTIYQELLLDQDADAANQMTFVPLPFVPDRSSDFALGVIVEIPADAAANPPAAIEITGATYTTDGKTHTLEFNRQGYVSRIAEDGTWCEQHKDSNDGG